VTNLIQSGQFNSTIAKEVGSSETAIRRFRKRHPELVPTAENFQGSTTVGEDEAEASTPLSRSPITLDDPDKMLRDRGLDPDEWFIDRTRGIELNEWGNPDNLNYQAKFKAVRKVPETLLQPVRTNGWTPPNLHPNPFAVARDNAELIVVCGDQQAPFHDHKLHALFCDWLSFNAPERGVILGDLLDFPDISRHPSDPDNNARVMECLQAGYEIIRDYVAASPLTKWQFIRGNHDQRLRQYVIDKSPLLYGLHRVLTDEESDKEFAHSLAWLMRFDELGVEFVDTNGTYEDAQITLSKNLAVRHGWVVRQGSGASALKTLEQTHHSIIVGHTHRQSVVYHTTHDVYHDPTTLVAVEVGCLCQMDNKPDSQGRRFPSYGVYPDWQQGFAVVHLHDDGKFHVSLANYVNSTLLWADQRYQ
jgi:predicted phosphodiesterase